MQAAGIEIMETVTGLIAVLTFVGLPFYINTVKTGFAEISPRLEHVSRSLGASAGATFFRVTLPPLPAGVLPQIGGPVRRSGGVFLPAGPHRCG